MSTEEPNTEPAVPENESTLVHATIVVGGFTFCFFITTAITSLFTTVVEPYKDKLTPQSLSAFELASSAMTPMGIVTGLAVLFILVGALQSRIVRPTRFVLATLGLYCFWLTAWFLLIARPIMQINSQIR